jgi:transcriptional regulator GlxA family with amidase domain
MTPSSPSPRRIVMVAYPGANALDVIGPLEVFAVAGRLAVHGPDEVPAYATEIVATAAGTLESQSGVGLVVSRPLGAVRGEIDTLLVAGGLGTPTALRDRALLSGLRRLAPRARRLGSVCTGSFVLAEAGLLDGRRATTHWMWCRTLAERYPRVRVEPDPIFVRDGTVYTSAGVTAGMDLALALVEEDLGRDLALQVARQMVLFLRRPGGQSQFSAQLAVQAADRQPLRELQAWIVERPDSDCSVATLAHHVAMSPRNFARVFLRETGMTPAHYVERVRVEAARRRLEESADGVDAIAGCCGFGTAETMRRAFLRHLRVAPSDYRTRFRAAS